MLLVGSILFYILFYRSGWWIILITILVSYFCGLMLDKTDGIVKKIYFIFSITLVVLPWVVLKRGITIIDAHDDIVKWIVPIGISFYTMQLISYLADIYMCKIKPEKNMAKFALFVSFFPQVLQGPIPRYEQLHGQLIEGHEFDEKSFVKGIYYVIWGFFLKLVIADKASVIVDAVFDNCPLYTGVYIWTAAFLYSIQIYADFLACTTLAQGVAKMFGIELAENFKMPYLAVSVNDFWKRWHISLSRWLRDYIYIPLGGNRKGQVRKEINLVLTFLISGIWHGAGLNFIVWGMVHAFYQIISKYTTRIADILFTSVGASVEKTARMVLKRIGTFFWITMAWMIFRAENLRTALRLFKHMFFDVNPWILFNDGLFSLGLSWKEVIVLILSIIVLFKVDVKHENGVSISDYVLGLKLPVRWGITIGVIVIIMVFGTYGAGFNATDFIYGGF